MEASDKKTEEQTLRPMSRDFAASDMAPSGTSKNCKYSTLPTSEPGADGFRGIPSLRRNSKNKRWRKYTCLLPIGNATVFLLTLMMYIDMFRRQSHLNAKLRATSSYTPIYDMIDLEPTMRQINGTVHPPKNPGIARQFPNAEADAKWFDDIELIRPIPITREQILLMGKNPDTVAKLEDKDWGLGDNAYVAVLDMFHNLHCVNALRKAAYGTYYNVSEANATNHGQRYEEHINHCVDILFQHISCSNNLNMVTRHWKEGFEYPFPDFSINKHCINFEKLVTWHKTVSIDMDKYLDKMRKPAGVKEESATSI